MDRFDIVTEEAFDIIYHTYRMKIIDAFGSTEGMVATFKQIADLLGDNSSKVTYHGKMMIKIGLLVPDHTEKINGIIAKYYRLVSDIFKISFGDKNDPIMRKKFMKSQANVVLNGLEHIHDMVSDLNHDSRSIAFVMNEIYLTKEEQHELWQTLEKFAAKKERSENTSKVTLYSLIISDNDEDCCNTPPLDKE